MNQREIQDVDRQLYELEWDMGKGMLLDELLAPEGVVSEAPALFRLPHPRSTP